MIAMKTSAEYNRAMLDKEIKDLNKRKMKISKTKGVKTPTRGHENDAGIDFYVPWEFGEFELKPGRQVIIDSGIKANVPKGHALVAFNKSGIATKKQLLVGACVIDCGYQGSIHLNVHNVGILPQLIEPGEKIVQFLLLKLGDAIVEEVPEHALFAEVSARGEGKFGSTNND
jgi:dUTP pyrophosphatase